MIPCNVAVLWYNVYDKLIAFERRPQLCSFTIAAIYPGPERGRRMIDSLQAGISAARRGQRQQARQLFQQALREDLTNEQAWLWMSTVVDTQAEKQVCLERALTINPNNQGAQAELDKLAVADSLEEGRFPLRPLDGKNSPKNGGTTLSSLRPDSAYTSEPSMIRPLATAASGNPAATSAVDLRSLRRLPPQLLPDQSEVDWTPAPVENSGLEPLSSWSGQTPVMALALTGCLSVTAVSGLLVLALLWLIGWPP